MKNPFSNIKKTLLIGFAIVAALILGIIAFICQEKSSTEEEENQQEVEIKKQQPKKEEKPMTSEEIFEQLDEN